MPKQRKTPRKERKRPVKIQYIPRPAGKPRTADTAEPYAYLDRLVKEHHEHLADARIALAWKLDVKADRDGHLILGQCRKATDLDREFREFDAVILLNAVAWKQLDARQRIALVDHELCHLVPVEDKEGNPVYDERDRRCYRIRQHDVEEFHAVVKRNGMWLSDVAELVRAAQDAPLFTNGEAVKS